MEDKKEPCGSDAGGKRRVNAQAGGGRCRPRLARRRRRGVRIVPLARHRRQQDGQLLLLLLAIQDFLQFGHHRLRDRVHYSAIRVRLKDNSVGYGTGTSFLFTSYIRYYNKLLP